MDEGTVQAIIELAAVALPFVVAGLVWLEKKLSAIKEQLGISNDQGDLMMSAANVVFAIIEAKVGTDVSKKAALDKGREILAKMKACWEDEAGTTEMLKGYMDELEQVLKGL